MRPSPSFIAKTIIGILALFFYCEYLIYYIILRDCTWPELDPKNEDPNIQSTNETPVHVMVIADTHLLGSRHGHWFDKLRREWQMHRAFQTALSLHKPDMVFVLGDLTDEGLFCGRAEFEYYVKRFYNLFAVPKNTQLFVAVGNHDIGFHYGLHKPDMVFVLGDLTDEGLFCGTAEFEYYVKRFYNLFAVPKNTQLFVAVGNHDIGFHYGISPYLNERFVSAFNAPAVKLVSLRGNHFVLLNSMALEGDGCFLCRPAELQLTKIEKILKCSKGTFVEKCDPKLKLNIYSRPILMQHYPLYRQSDMECDDIDSAPLPVKKVRFRQRWECLSQEATNQILNQLRPRLALSGHTHHGCTRMLPTGDGLEITIPSFSWRNKENPTFGMAVFSPNNYSFAKCGMPRESTVINMYIFGGTCLVFWLLYSIFTHSRRRKYKLR